MKGDRERQLASDMDGDSSTPVDRRTPAAAPATGRRERAATGAGATWTPTELIERLGGDEALARQLVTLFLSEYPSLLRTLRVSCTSGSADDVRRAAHAAKGCIANFTQGGPHATAYAIERLGAEGKVDEAARLVAALEQEVAALAALMNTFAQSASCAS